MRALLVLPLVLVFAAAGCGSSSDDTSSSSDNAGSAAATTSSGSGGNAYAPPPKATSGASANTVDIKNFAFNPTATKVKVGQKITWTNEDSTVHNVVADDGAFKSKDLEQGATFSYTATKPGTFSYVCTYHPNMKATLTVTG